MNLRRLVVLTAASLWFARAEDKPVFSSAGDCALCHTHIPAAEEGWYSGPWVGPYALWKGTMMAHAGSDPYWQAKVRFEVEQSPARRTLIEDTCLRCHAPAEQYPLRAAGRRLAMDTVGELGREGVTCTVCHQITPSGLGKAGSFTGGFQIGLESLIFGPHKNPFAMPMLHHTGFEPQEAEHVLDSALCGSCHTVITQPMVQAGQRQIHVEQAPFLEWLASSYPKTGRTCQKCHMPELEDGNGRPAAQYIAHRPPGGPFPPTRPRVPFGRHELAGGNTVITELLARENPQEATSLRATAEAARRKLEQALQLRVSTKQEAGWLSATVETVNLSGHKLPTGFPSRRLWLHVTLTDATERILFDSGAWDPSSGRLRAGEAYQPHYRVIEKPDQVQIFETEHLDGQNRPTLSLLKAASNRKDNRILPEGFDRQRLSAVGLDAFDISSAGTSGDDTFRSGSAQTVYRIPMSGSCNGCRLKVEALFQTIKPSHRPSTFVLPEDLSRPLVIARSETAL